ncbi:MAG: glycosyltransferase family 1 protein [Microthrixaceae bacterium]
MTPPTQQDRSRVLVNLTWLVPGVVGGSEESTTDALRALAADCPADLEIHLAVLRPFINAHPDLVQAFTYHVLDVDGRNKFLRVLAEQSWLARLAQKIDAQVVHHAGGVVPLRHPGRIVLTIHDLQPLDMAQNFSLAKRLYLRAMLGRSADAAAVICVPSEFTLSRVVELLGVEQERIRVVPWCLWPRSVSLLDDSPLADSPLADSPLADSSVAEVQHPSQILSQLGNDCQYFVYPAVTYAHKNHLLLIEAFATLVPNNPNLRLVLTGSAGPLEPQVQHRIDQLGLSELVLRTHRIPAAELKALITHALAVVVPSMYEGFGLPALEAMSLGCLVLGSNQGSLPEVLRPEDLVAGQDLTAWAEAMQAVVVLTDSERAERIAAGLDRAAAFTPHRTARALCESYRAALVARPI